MPRRILEFTAPSSAENSFRNLRRASLNLPYERGDETGSKCPQQLGRARIAIVHDWLVTWRGGEQVLGRLASWLPQADLYTLVADPQILPRLLACRRITTSWLQRLPFRRHFRWALPLFPWTIEQFHLKDYDLVISISHSVARGVPTHGVPHLSYCLTPMRYAWVCPDAYFGPAGCHAWSAPGLLTRYLRWWERATRDRVDTFVAISKTVQARIRSCYKRESCVVYPPVDCQRFAQVPRAPSDYFLVVSALVPYKRTDLAIQAFNRLKKPLVIIGTGPEIRRLKHLAGPSITFVGWQSPEQLARWFAGARALIYPQEEDFGIAAVEAQAAGCPVVAFRRGGATETVIDGVTGTFFDAQTPEALIDAVERLERLPVDPSTLRQHAWQFNPERFDEELSDLLSRTWDARIG